MLFLEIYDLVLCVLFGVAVIQVAVRWPSFRPSIQWHPLPLCGTRRPSFWWPALPFRGTCRHSIVTCLQILMVLCIVSLMSCILMPHFANARSPGPPSEGISLHLSPAPSHMRLELHDELSTNPPKKVEVHLMHLSLAPYEVGAASRALHQSPQKG